MSDTPETAEYWKQRHEDLGEMARQDREELTATIEQLTQDLAGAEDALSDLENLHLQMIAERDELQPKADAFDVLEGWQKTGAVRKLDSVRLAQYRGVSLLTAIQQAEEPTHE